MSTEMQVAPAAGWYANPEGAGQRYWDGFQWTDHVNESAPPPPSVPAVIVADRQGNGFAVAALVLGLVGVFVGGAMNILFFLGWGFGVAALVFGLLGRRRPVRRTMATWGIVLGIASFAIGIYGASQVNKAVDQLNTAGQQLDSYSACVQNAGTLADMEQC